MKIRVIPALDQSKPLLAWCQTPIGRWGLLAAFLLTMMPLGRQWLLAAVLLSLTTALPQYRSGVVSACGIGLAVLIHNWLDIPFLNRISAKEGLGPISGLTIGAVISAVVLVLGLIAATAFRFPRSRILRRPVLTAALCLAFLVGALSTLPLTGWTRVIAWTGLLAVCQMFWFFCYTLTDRGAASHGPVLLQAGLWRPAWMAMSGSSTPFVKGASYLRKIKVRNAEELAVTQLKGMKLLLWALVLKGIDSVFHYLTSRAGIPELAVAFGQSASGRPFAWYWNCLSLIQSFFSSLMLMSIGGHQIIACARMAGFRALRNTYRPLESRSLAEFWNRYYFYFKELMADMFFFPTYLRYFKKNPRLRMIVATMAAAFIGNALYHFVSDIRMVSELGWQRSVAGFQTYLFYSCILGIAISLSQLRSHRKSDPGQSWWRNRLVPGLWVSGFFCILHIFDDTGRAYSLGDHFVFVGRLIGI